MLHILLSKDKTKLKGSIESLSGSLYKTKMDSVSFDINLLSLKLDSAPLFGMNEEVIIFTDLSLGKEAFLNFTKLVDRMVESDKVFILIEEGLNKAELDAFKKAGAKIEENKSEKKEFAKGDFNVADAFGQKSAKNTWVELQKSLNKGLDIESVFASIVAKARDMLYTTKSKQNDALMHPFIYTKATNDIKKWPKKDLEKVYDSLIDLHYKARMGGEDLEVGLEKIILNL